LRVLPSTLASSETRGAPPSSFGAAAVQQGQAAAVSSDWTTLIVPVRQG
ncbi:hypothetical protein T4E_238, partial [Trichinella pseudospiralis]